MTLERAGGLDAEQVVSVSVMLPWESERGLRAGSRDERSTTTAWRRSSSSARSAPTRRRLMDFVTEQLRRRLAIVRSLQEERGDDWD